MFSVASCPSGDITTARDHIETADKNLWVWHAGAALSDERRAAGVAAYLAISQAIEDLRAAGQHLAAELGAADRAYERVCAAIPHQRACEHEQSGKCGMCEAHAETLRIHGF